MEDTVIKVEEPTSTKIYNPLTGRYIAKGGSSYKMLLRDGYLDVVNEQPTQKLSEYIDEQEKKRKDRKLLANEARKIRALEKSKAIDIPKVDDVKSE